VNTQTRDQRGPPDAQSQAVASYLETHPEFFEHHPELLEYLRIPHPSGEAVSLIERQVEQLRQQATLYKQRLDELISVAQENDLLADRLHRLTLSLIDAATFDEVMNTLQDELHDEFRADLVEVRLFSRAEFEEQRGASGGSGGSGDNVEIEAFQDLFQQDRPVCGRLRRGQLEYLFGSDADDTRSVALIPLRGPHFVGMLAIGSRDQDRFHEGKSTDFLVRLGELVSRALRVVSLPGV